MGILSVNAPKIGNHLHDRIGMSGNGEEPSSLLHYDNVAVASTRAGPPFLPFTATALTKAGAVTLTGRQASATGDDVFRVWDMSSSAWVDVTSNFESNISISGQIQQTAPMAGQAIMVWLRPVS